MAHVKFKLDENMPAEDRAMPSLRLVAGIAAALAFSVTFVRSPGASDPPVDGRVASTDLFGDPLPKGAIARMGTTRLRHGGAVERVAWFPDGHRLASIGMDQTLRVWDVSRGIDPSLA